MYETHQQIYPFFAPVFFLITKLRCKLCFSSCRKCQCIENIALYIPHSGHPGAGGEIFCVSNFSFSLGGPSVSLSNLSFLPHVEVG
jgi:hypothetical protein